MKHFALVAAAFEAGLVLVALGLGRLLGTPPLETFQRCWRDVGLGIAATLPPLVLFWLCLKWPIRPFQRIAKILDESIVPLFRECRLVQLAEIAVLAGIGEEMLFRGVVQAAVRNAAGGPWAAWIGLAAAACLFGMLHPITPTYAMLATLIGLYLGWLWMATGNLLVPMTTHAAYDFLALLYLLKARGRISPSGGNPLDPACP